MSGRHSRRCLVASGILSAGVAAVVFACSGPSGGAATTSCPNLGDLPCPSTPPSYKDDVQPILMNRCYGCHAPGGIEASKVNLTTYAGVVGNSIYYLVSNCLMPPPDAGQLTRDERTTLFEWIACSEPNN